MIGTGKSNHYYFYLIFVMLTFYSIVTRPNLKQLNIVEI